MEKYADLQTYRNEAGRFDRFPGKRQKNKQALMLHFLAEQFELDRTYTEKEVNAILNAHHDFNDPATLRRLMFGMKLLDRKLDGTAYWRVGN